VNHERPFHFAFTQAIEHDRRGTMPGRARMDAPASVCTSSLYVYEAVGRSRFPLTISPYAKVPFRPIRRVCHLILGNTSYNTGTYDLQSITQPLLGSTQFLNYDAAGYPGSITDVNGQSQTLLFDGKGRLRQVTNLADSSRGRSSTPTVMAGR